MPFLDVFALEPLPKNWHAESVAWRETYFPEMPEVMDTSHWNRFYPEVPVPTVATIFAKPDAFAGFASKTVGATPATSDLSGRVWKAEDLDDNRFNTALKIIRAQASTDLGSISFSKKRVCVEELRHHYQMAGVLTLDRGWDEPRWGRHWATETLEELFSMKPGEHVLDAFNIEFKTLLDSATFMSFIDRVGKFQLEMQHHFLYGPMALSMPWMRFLEESYHLAAGETLMKAIAVAGTLNGGNFGIEDLQKTLNMWYPRGLEMFGSELGGDLVKGVFKTLKNREAQMIYIDEVLGKVKDANLAIIQAKGRCSREEADAALRKITQKGETVHGLTKDDLLSLPDRRFFRIRGLAEFGDYRNPGSDAAGVGYVYLPYDVHGTILTDRGKPIERDAYVDYLRAVLPTRYMTSRHWEFVKSDFLFNDKWGTPEPSGAE